MQTAVDVWGGQAGPDVADVEVQCSGGNMVEPEVVDGASIGGKNS